MTPARSTILTLTLAAAAAAILHAALVHHHAAAAHGRALQTLQRTDAEIASLHTDRARIPSWANRHSPPSPTDAPQLAARFASALAAAGLPPSSLSSFAPEPDTLLASSPGNSAGGPPPPSFRAVRSRAAVSLNAVTLPRLGVLIETWRSRERDWRIAAIEVSPDTHSGAPHTPGGDAPLRCLLTLERVAVSTTEPPS